jgi:hypothetical protein
LSSVMMESTTLAALATARGPSTTRRPRLRCASRALSLRSQAITSQPMLAQSLRDRRAHPPKADKPHQTEFHRNPACCTIG